jgi:hypothetical protein
MAAQKATTGLNKGGRPKKKTGSGPDPVSEETPPTLAEAGIGKHLADEARKLEALSAEQFETKAAEIKAGVKQSPSRRRADYEYGYEDMSKWLGKLRTRTEGRLRLFVEALQEANLSGDDRDHLNNLALNLTEFARALHASAEGIKERCQWDAASAASSGLKRKIVH